jgi:propanol-preferring alcohol dehydrogenase
MQLPDPQPCAGQLLIDILACGVCRTDLHLVDRALAHPEQPARRR